jgi:hypothetical protein
VERQDEALLRPRRLEGAGEEVELGVADLEGVAAGDGSMVAA